MTILTIPPPTVSRDPRPHRWPCQEFHDLNERGAFLPNRAMLIDGVIGATPVPDFAVGAGAARDFATVHPTTASLGSRYADVTIHHPPATIAPLAAPAGAVVAVADLLL